MNTKETALYNVAKRAINLIEATDYKTTVDVFNKIKKEIVNRQNH